MWGIGDKIVIKYSSYYNRVCNQRKQILIIQLPKWCTFAGVLNVLEEKYLILCEWWKIWPSPIGRLLGRL